MMEKFIMADGCAVRVSDTRHGDRTIVLLHGYLESIEVWEDFTALLKPHLRVIAIDLPGHGVSEVKGEVHTMEFLADTVHAALRELGVEQAVICGHSMGGYAALEFLRRHPQATDGLIMFHSVPFADTPEKKEQRDREIAAVLAGKKDLLIGGVAKSFASANRARFADAIEELGDQVVLTDDAGVVALLRGMEQRRDNSEMLRESRVPQLFIFGRDDEYIPVSVAEEIASSHPQARVVWLERSGHMGFIEELRAAADTVLAFCNEMK
ncbi:MAG: alpha/beta hydrolase [Rikenellaceae bacterium]|nr:alpha/beta hydrolase [Rikenellaceae bacterium]MCL2693453.1 alpha/beta hydrolase [Rikenellaceae bacterium]